MNHIIGDANRVLEREGLPLRLRASKQSIEGPTEDGLSVCIFDPRSAKHFQSIATILYRPELGLSVPRSPSFEAGEFVFSPRITPSWADYFRRHGVMFLDGRGNCFVDQGGLYVDVRGRTLSGTGSRQAVKRVASRQVSSAQNLFTPSRAQVSGLLLSCPDLLGATTREISRQSGTSMGTTVQTLNLLVDSGYLFKTEIGFRFAPDRLVGLIDAWADAYPAALGRRLELFRGRAEIENFREISPLGAVSGEHAVPELVRGGDSVELYLADESDLKGLIRDSRIKPDPSGNVVVRKIFWQFSDLPEATTGTVGQGVFADWQYALNVVVYSDLRATQDPRLIEVADDVKTEMLEKINEG